MIRTGRSKSIIGDQNTEMTWLIDSGTQFCEGSVSYFFVFKFWGPIQTARGVARHTTFKSNKDWFKRRHAAGVGFTTRHAARRQAKPLYQQPNGRVFF